MKKCPFCAEEIQDEAIKCRFCGEFIDKKSLVLRSEAREAKIKWYYSTSTVVIALLCVGPLALPLVWLNPRYKIITKLVVTVAVIVLSILLCYLTAGIYSRLTQQIEGLGIH